MDNSQKLQNFLGGLTKIKAWELIKKLEKTEDEQLIEFAELLKSIL